MAMSYEGRRPGDDELGGATPEQLETFRRLELRYNVGQGEERWLNLPFDLRPGGVLTMQNFVREPDGHPRGDLPTDQSRREPRSALVRALPNGLADRSIIQSPVRANRAAEPVHVGHEHGLHVQCRDEDCRAAGEVPRCGNPACARFRGPGCGGPRRCFLRCPAVRSHDCVGDVPLTRDRAPGTVSSPRAPERPDRLCIRNRSIPHA